MRGEGQTVVGTQEAVVGGTKGDVLLHAELSRLHHDLFRVIALVGVDRRVDTELFTPEQPVPRRHTQNELEDLIEHFLRQPLKPSTQLLSQGDPGSIESVFTPIRSSHSRNRLWFTHQLSAWRGPKPAVSIPRVLAGYRDDPLHEQRLVVSGTRPRQAEAASFKGGRHALASESASDVRASPARNGKSLVALSLQRLKRSSSVRRPPCFLPPSGCLAALPNSDAF